MKTSSIYLALGAVPLVMGAPLRQRLDRESFASAAEIILAGGPLDNKPSFDNRPVTLTKADDISLLDLPRPIVIQPEPKGEESPQNGGDEVFFELSEMDIIIAIPTSQSGFGSRPCRFARASRIHNDVLVVFLAVTFLLVVLALEMWISIRNYMRTLFPQRGAIRLDNDTKTDGQLSVKAWPEGLTEAQDEKTSIQI